MTSCGERSSAVVTDAEWTIDFERAGWLLVTNAPTVVTGRFTLSFEQAYSSVRMGVGSSTKHWLYTKRSVRPVIGFHRFRCSRTSSAAG